jgi:hypothetical protein
VRPVPPAVSELAGSLRELRWVTHLMVAGSLATGDYVPGVSDVDLVALVDGPVDPDRQSTLEALHRALDAGSGRGLDVGCAYAEATRLLDRSAVHPTWTHGAWASRRVSGVARAELVRHGFSLLGGAPQDTLPAMDDDDVREAAREELRGYWAWATRRPLMWLHPVIADLGLTSMARGRYTVTTGRLITKAEAMEHVRAPQWLVDQLRSRRRGERVTSPRLPTAAIAWTDACRTMLWLRRR